MRRRRTDMGLVLVGLLLLGVGGYVLVTGEIWFSRTAVTEYQSMSGPGALAVGVAFVVLGLYFLYQSRR
ncbi:hypothetical protein [Thioalkalivibrio thiocyanodenitrificans]|uniref:hypothetical protein n=1 Tax=Thioalkalivibrio thiocyanodenitrificans TaxID=243063 RepID=UPI000475B4C0|nr:hypothetical protein [Thioalkalivibrio thiocyanodenitrificans]